jgi:heavy metal sensor kinase
LWYSGILLIALLAFSLIVDLSVRANVQKGVDSGLQVRMKALEVFMQREIPRHLRAQMNHEFQELVELSPGGQMIQVLDGSRHWLYQSESIRGFALPAPDSVHPADLTTEVLKGVPVRIKTAIVEVGGENYTAQLATNLDTVYLAIDRFRLLLVALIPLMVIVASAGGYWLSRRALAPINAIIEDARSIGLWNISRRLLVPATGDELQRLSETLNDMIQRLELAFRRITQFTADVSHELRAPVALIRCTAELALIEPRDAPTYRAALTDILLEGERTTKLVEDLLTIARADSGTERMNMILVDLSGPLLDACSQGTLMAERKKVNFSTVVVTHQALVQGDGDALRRLFLILIDNAVKYTPGGGSVKVKLTVNGDAACVSVRDTGIGISGEDLEHIFERFYRADKARQRDSGGVGLGLSIARWIAESHEATINVESRPGGGSDFVVRLATVK